MLLAATSLALSSCGGNSSSSTPPPPPPTTYTIGGTVSGLSGSGLVLQNNAGDNLAVSASGAFTFKTSIASGGAYKVTVLTQPSTPAQTCTVTSGSGTATAKVTSVQVACATVTYTIGGTISGLTGTGLVLQDNGGDNLTVTANGPFTFATQVASGGNYAVTVLTQPTGPAQTCVVTSGSATATANVTSVQVACVNAVTYTIGGTTSGLTGTGLVLQDNGGDNLAVTANGAFTFLTPIASGAKYNVTVLTQPTAQNCVVTGGSATVTAKVTNVQVTCGNAPTYTIGGTISHLSGIGLVLQDNGGDNLPILQNQTSFTFATQIASGSKYLVTVLTQPSSPPQTCTVTSGSGTVTAAVTNVAVTCGGAPNEWTWVNGSDTDNQIGIYGTLGTADPANVPGARGAGVAWTDASGNLWLFGGYGLDSNGTTYDLNDLWEYSAGEWTWIGGSNFADQRGTYGTLGTADPANIPGARELAASWIDSSGNAWLFGGWGADSIGRVNVLNDLWEYSAGEWTWMSGADVYGQQGTYGVLGTAAPGNVPGAREYPITWTDSTGNLWLFGGWGEDSAGTTGFLNDLWMFSAGQWTWMGGSNLAGQPGTYGTLGTSAPGNIPGGRQYAQSWTDTSGNFWLFGGLGLGSTSSPQGTLNDLWKYSAGEWTWEGGGNSISQVGNYGTEGIAALTNVPGSRGGASAWIDTNGNFWLFGGQGIDSKGAYGNLNDLWKYNSGAWTWMNGSNLGDQPGTYGTLGIAGPGNTPGARYLPVSWSQGSGDLWLLGGFVVDQSSGSVTYFNDLWEYAPSTPAVGHETRNHPAAKLSLTPP
jgi:N-acetylneuraminic acid mutarotase